MPVMDGLELIRAIREHDKAQKIIILSCHESFSYAREAMRLGVFDYLIKDAITSEVLYDALARTLDVNKKLINDKASTANPTNNGILNLALKKDVPLEQPAALIRSVLMDKQNYFCCTVKLENLHYSHFSMTDSICENILNVLSEFDGGEAYPLRDDIFLILAFAPVDFSQINMANRRFNLIQNIRIKLENLTSCVITVGVSSCVKDPLLLRKTIDEARQAINGRVFLGNGRTIYYNPIMNQTLPAQVKALDLRINNVKIALENRDVKLLERELTILYKKDLYGMMQYNYLQHINTVLLGMLTTSCSANGISYHEVFDADTVSMNDVIQLQTASEMCSWYVKHFKAFMAALQKHDELLYSPRIKLIHNYICENYCSDISLDTIADSFGINKVYLAKIFKEKFGQSVNEYIRELRIEKAKKLLCQYNICINDIAQQLGFNNPQTFYNTFKRYVGVSPGKYRENHMALSVKAQKGDMRIELM